MMVYVALQAPADDLFYLNEEHPDWKQLMNYYSLVVSYLLVMTI